MKLIKAFIILIDLSGYTKFIRMHKVSLIHAEHIISELLAGEGDRYWPSSGCT